MQTIQQRTHGLVLDRLTANRTGQVITLAAIGGAGLNRGVARAQDATPADFEAPVDVINYALTLEHIENAFYMGVADFAGSDFEAIGFQAGVKDRLTAIGEHEAAHVDALTAVVKQLGGDPVKAGEYDFGYGNLTEFLQVAAALEGVGVAAYGGAAQYLIDEDDLLTAALTIHGVEARHASYLNVVNGTDPFPAAFEKPMTKAEVLEAASPFIKSM
jgi:ferritin-like protein